MYYDDVLGEMKVELTFGLDVAAESERDLQRKLDEFYDYIEDKINRRIDGWGEFWMMPDKNESIVDREGCRYVVEVSTEATFMYSAGDAPYMFEKNEQVLAEMKRGQLLIGRTPDKMSTGSVNVTNFTEKYLSIKIVNGEGYGEDFYFTMTVDEFVRNRGLEPVWKERILSYLDNYVDPIDGVEPEYSESILSDSLGEAMEEYGD